MDVFEWFDLQQCEDDKSDQDGGIVELEDFFAGVGECYTDNLPYGVSDQCGYHGTDSVKGGFDVFVFAEVGHEFGYDDYDNEGRTD